MCWVINFARKKHLIIDSEVWKGEERNFGAWRFEDFQEGDANKNHSRKKKKQLAPVKKRMQTLFEGRNPSSNCVVFSVHGPNLTRGQRQAAGVHEARRPGGSRKTFILKKINDRCLILMIEVDRSQKRKCQFRFQQEVQSSESSAVSAN